MIKFVFFDLDDTILDFHKAERTAIKKTLKSYSIKVNKNMLDLYSKINLGEWKKLEKKELTHEQVKVRRFEVFLKEINKNFDAKEMTKNYEKNLEKEDPDIMCLVEVDNPDYYKEKILDYKKPDELKVIYAERKDHIMGVLLAFKVDKFELLNQEIIYLKDNEKLLNYQ